MTKPKATAIIKRLDFHCVEVYLNNALLPHEITEDLEVTVVIEGLKTWEVQKKLYLTCESVGSNTIITAKAGYLDCILEGIGKHFDLEILRRDKFTHIEVCKQWQDLFIKEFNDDRGHISLAKDILAHRLGAYNIYTGFGKTELQLCLIDSILSSTEDNVLVLVPYNALRDNLIDRNKKYQSKYNLPIYKDNPRVRIINPMGFMRSYNSGTEETLEIFKEITTYPTHIIVDECHHISATSYQTLLSSIKTIKSIYGFSASIEKSGGNLIMSHDDLYKIKEHEYKILSQIGYAKTHLPLPKNIELITVEGRISDLQEVNKYIEYMNSEGKQLNWNYMVELLVMSDKFVGVIKELLAEYKSKIYINIFQIDTGIKLADKLSASGIKCLYWSGASGIYPEEYDVGDNPVNSINKSIDDIDCLITSAISVEGVNIPALSLCIFLSGKNFRVTVQSIGRCTRGDDITVVLFYDQNNSMVTKQSKAKRKNIVKDFGNINFKEKTVY